MVEIILQEVLRGWFASPVTTRSTAILNAIAANPKLTVETATAKIVFDQVMALVAEAKARQAA